MLTRQLTVWCDEPDCVEFEQVDGGDARVVRQQLRLQGWGRRDGGDLCPVHARAVGIRPTRYKGPTISLAELAGRP